jgi:hypothetical protein
MKTICITQSGQNQNGKHNKIITCFWIHLVNFKKNKQTNKQTNKQKTKKQNKTNTKKQQQKQNRNWGMWW